MQIGWTSQVTARVKMNTRQVLDSLYIRNFAIEKLTAIYIYIISKMVEKIKVYIMTRRVLRILPRGGGDFSYFFRKHIGLEKRIKCLTGKWFHAKNFKQRTSKFIRNLTCFKIALVWWLVPFGTKKSIFCIFLTNQAIFIFFRFLFWIDPIGKNLF